MSATSRTVESPGYGKIFQSYYKVFYLVFVNSNHLPGATIISCFLDRILKKVRSFCGSMSRTVLLAFDVSCVIKPAYCTVVELSNVVLIGIPKE